MRKKKHEVKSAADLAERMNPDNPRTITPERLAMLAESMKRFGDLSGFVLNVRTGRLVGGHQRVKLSGDAPVAVAKRYARPTKVGTIAEGYVQLDGERFAYREVSWDSETERAAMIAANKHGGDWDDYKLRELLGSLREADFPMDFTGFDTVELDKLLAEVVPPQNFQVVDENIAIQHRCPKCGYQWSGKPGA
jgi:hypothetical protein